MGLIKKEDIENSYKKEAHAVIEKFLDGDIVPEVIFNSLQVKTECISSLRGLTCLPELVSEITPQALLEPYFYAAEIWKDMDRGKRYHILVNLIIYDANIDVANEMAEKIFKEHYTEYIVNEILNGFNFND